MPRRINEIERFVSDIQSSPSMGRLVVHHREIPAKKARYADVSEPWPDEISSLLDKIGVGRLYSHQAKAIDEVRAGRNVAIATATASGKTHVYNLPFLEAVLKNPKARALYLFPLKALAQDQLKTFEALAALFPNPPTAAVYDGDTKDAARRKIRANPPNALFTNPEMLHLALLPFHSLWREFFSNLAFVVVDEMHTYRGVMGSHMAWVFRRLARICAWYGANPVFVLCSATIANPAELGGRLIGQKISLVNETGAGAGKKHLIFVNPDSSMPRAAIRILKAAVKRQMRTIVYTQSRKLAELLAMWTSSRVGDFSRKICSYRAGYLPEERRDIESRLASGELLAVVSTSALELGIDIGNLDLCLLAGYPGTVMATLQRGGRVGRQMADSAVILVAGEDALDQYFMNNPDDFFSRGAEAAVINPENPIIAARHVECAASELPLTVGDPFLSDSVVKSVLFRLVREGRLLRDHLEESFYAAKRGIHREVDLRGSGDQYRIALLTGQEGEDGLSGPTIGHIDGNRVFRETHPGAVYLHQGKTHLVKSLDLAGKTAGVKSCRVDYYTTVRAEKDTEILEVFEEKQVGGARVYRGRLKVTDQVTGYEKKQVKGGKSLGITPLDLPPSVFETRGLWFAVPKEVMRQAEAQKLHFMGGIHAMEHAAIGILPLIVMCDRNDLGGISTPLHPQVGGPAVFIYDSAHGGVGLSDIAFVKAAELLEKTRKVIESCRCELGCPSCVHSPKCGSGNRPIDKKASLFILTAMQKGGAGGRNISQKQVPTVKRDKLDETGPLGMFLSGISEAAAHEEPPSSVSGGKPSKTAGRGKPILPENLYGLKESRVSRAEPKTETGGMGRVMAKSVNFAVLDVETRRSAEEVGGWHKARSMGVSVAVLYDSVRDEFFDFPQEGIEELYARLTGFDLVVGFNIMRFDYEVLSAHSRGNFRKLPTLDMLAEIYKTLGYRLSLNSLAKATLGTEKSADGLVALEWWKEGRVAEIVEYCRKDVAVTRDLYLYGAEKGHLLFTNKAQKLVEVPVKWGSQTEK